MLRPTMGICMMDWLQVISEACPLITTGCPNSSACWVSIFDGVAPFGTDPAVVKKPNHIGNLNHHLFLDSTCTK